VFRKRKKLPSNEAVTVCCEATIKLHKVGEEMFVRCSKCDEYVGHLVGRGISTLETHYKSLIHRAFNDRRLQHPPTDAELQKMYPTYCEYVNEFAKQAARKTVDDYIPRESLNKR
jgi:hypothetical protein